ncbi:MAG: polysaccharide deacetylase family protein [Muribaculum sp.]|nr:polysaccharide deacetylase family protein [Muribaculum sp.]
MLEDGREFSDEHPSDSSLPDGQGDAAENDGTGDLNDPEDRDALRDQEGMKGLEDRDALRDQAGMEDPEDRDALRDQEGVEDPEDRDALNDREDSDDREELDSLNDLDDLLARRRRVRRFKHLILYTLLFLLVLPTVGCIVLMLQVGSLNRKIDELTDRMAVLEQSDRWNVMMSGTASGPGRLYAGSGGGEIPKAGASGGVSDASPELESAEETDLRRKVYLTFDDGPSIYTDDILDILAEYDIKATFFVVGKEDERSKEAILQIVENGHTLGMHSYSHKYSELYASLENFEADFEKQRSFLEELTGETCRFYRFPGGSSNTVSKEDMHLFIDYLESQDMVFYDWNVSSGDGSSGLLSVDALVANSTSDVEQWNTAVILLHDSADKRTTVEALPRIIERIQAMDNTVFLPITEETTPIQHIH